MGSKYPPSVRLCLPLWALVLQAAFILIFTFFTSYDASPKNQKMFLLAYQGAQDITIMAALGLGFLTSTLQRQGWSSVAFNLFLLAFGVQWAVLLDGFLSRPFRWNLILRLSSIQQATMSTVSVLISAGAVLGKVNLVQLLVMALLEVTVFSFTRMVSRLMFSMESHTELMFSLLFATYFGLMVTWCLPSPLHEKAEKLQTATSPSLFAMLGTLFLWIFWPSFNSCLLETPTERRNAVFSTYYALAVSAVTAASISALTHPQMKISMTHVHNAVLAGGVAVGTPGHLIRSPCVAMVLGLVAGLISTGGAKCLQVSLHRILEIHDPSGVHYTFGLPGLLGGISSILLMVLQIRENPMIGSLVLNDVGALSFTVVMALASGLLTGLLLNLKIWKAPHVAKYFDDQTFWEFPHLAVGL